MTITKENLKKLIPDSPKAKLMWGIIATIIIIGGLVSLYTANLAFIIIAVLVDIVVFIFWFIQVNDIDFPY